MSLDGLASTTRQWNCGDEFIFFGVRNLIEDVLGQNVNWVIYDRNPDVRRHKEILGNSYTDNSLDKINFIVIAGSPQWYGRALQPLFNQLLKYEMPILFLGVGIGSRMPLPFTQLDKNILNKSQLIVTRDNEMHEMLKKFDFSSQVCPAFFASKITNLRKSKSRVGFVIQNDRKSQKIPTALKKTMISKCKELDGVMISHYINEFFSLPESRYSYDAKDYLEIYEEFDIIVSTRLHGAILAMSLGIPAILTNHDPRCLAAAVSFPHLKVCAVKDVEKTIDEMDVSQISAKIIEHKESAYKEYKELIKVCSINKECRGIKQ